MVVGFNHNFRYKGEMFHVQTEDGGLKSPNIVTLLYRGGTILGSQKTSYADIAKIDNLEQVVEELMKEQHKEMLRRLRAGDFDEAIAGRVATRKSPVGESVAAPAPAAVTPAAPVVAPPPEVPAAPAAAVPAPATSPAAATKSAAPAVKPPEPVAPPAVELGLDDIILSYLVGDDKK